MVLWSKIYPNSSCKKNTLPKRSTLKKKKKKKAGISTDTLQMVERASYRLPGRSARKRPVTGQCRWKNAEVGEEGTHRWRSRFAGRRSSTAWGGAAWRAARPWLPRLGELSPFRRRRPLLHYSSPAHRRPVSPRWPSRLLRSCLIPRRIPKNLHIFPRAAHFLIASKWMKIEKKITESNYGYENGWYFNVTEKSFRNFIWIDMITEKNR